MVSLKTIPNKALAYLTDKEKVSYMTNSVSSMDHLFAHSPNSDDEWHHLLQHLTGVAERAAAFAAPINVGDAARILGFWHDAGKFNPEWQHYLKQSALGHKTKGPEHAIVGFHLLLQAFPKLQMLAFLADCHHRGLRDIKVDFRQRKMLCDKHPWIAKSSADAKLLFAKHCSLTDPILPATFDHKKLISGRSPTLAWRMLHSCLVDADCLDTEAHYDPESAIRRSSPNPPILDDQTATPCLQTNLPRSIAELNSIMQLAQQNMSAPASDASDRQKQLYEHRQMIYRDALTAATLAPGFFSMTVPTGGGKTRSAMAFALAHAQQHQLRRVIVAIPYTSIIEQNASVYRDILGSDSVLEHHSSRRDLSTDESTDNNEEYSANLEQIERWQRLAADNWDAPIIVTTNVQLLESLFAARNSQLRKLHNIPQSVIIFDEVQTLPPKLLAPTFDVLRSLVCDFGCSIVFCTATQPAFSTRTLPTSTKLQPIEDIREIIDDPSQHFKALCRTNIHLPSPKTPKLSFEDLAEQIANQPRSLTILNTVKDTHTLLEHIKHLDGCFHLSSRLCPLHRSLILQIVHELLRNTQEECRLISTQVVEAGVDIDFPTVFRVMGPLDSLVQAAGRCNREARLEYGDVHIFELLDSSIPPGLYANATEHARIILPQLSSDLLVDPAVFQSYFRMIYSSVDTDLDNIRELEKNFAFRSISEKYRLIPENTRSVFIHPTSLQNSIQNYLDLLDQLSDQINPPSNYFVRYIQSALKALETIKHISSSPSSSLMRYLQPFSVSLYHHNFMKAQYNQLLEFVGGNLNSDLVLWRGQYDSLIGIVDAVDSTQFIF
jgi:CRISPR-associated endonuclease/helicase Cas3